MLTTKKQAYQRVWFKKNKEKARAWAREQYRKRKAFINSFKNKPCQDCGGVFPPCCMDFDHVRGKKSFNIGGGKMGTPSFEAIEVEIAKCDLVCANCHRIRTEKRGYWKRLPESN